MVVGGSFGVPDGQVAELFEPIEAALDDVALLVKFSVEGGWASATAAATAESLS